MITRKGSWGFDKVQQRSNNMKGSMPKWIGVTAKNWFLLGFRKGGKQTNDSLSGWDKRKKTDKGKRRGILIQSNNLRNSIRVLKSTWHTTIIGSEGLPYARIHNEGGTINHPGGTSYFIKNGKAIFVKKATAIRFENVFGRKLNVTQQHKIPIPKREFIGKSSQLEKKILDKIKSDLNLIFR